MSPGQVTVRLWQAAAGIQAKRYRYSHCEDPICLRAGDWGGGLYHRGDGKCPEFSMDRNRQVRSIAPNLFQGILPSGQVPHSTTAVEPFRPCPDAPLPTGAPRSQGNKVLFKRALYRGLDCDRGGVEFGSRKTRRIHHRWVPTGWQEATDGLLGSD